MSWKPVDAALFEAQAAGSLRLRLLASNGVGFDHIAMDARTTAGVIVCTTPDAAARPVSASISCFLFTPPECRPCQAHRNPTPD